MIAMSFDVWHVLVVVFEKISSATIRLCTEAELG